MTFSFHDFFFISIPFLSRFRKYLFLGFEVNEEASSTLAELIKCLPGVPTSFGIEN